MPRAPGGRSGWYTWCQRRTRISTRQQFRQHCDSVVLAAFTRSKQRYGAPRLTDELRAQGYPFNVKTVAASLRRQGLRAKASRKFSPVSYRAHGLPVSENLLEQDCKVQASVLVRSLLKSERPSGRIVPVNSHCAITGNMAGEVQSA